VTVVTAGGKVVTLTVAGAVTLVIVVTLVVADVIVVVDVVYIVEPEVRVVVVVVSEHEGADVDPAVDFD
jgi:hypothetical protein